MDRQDRDVICVWLHGGFLIVHCMCMPWALVLPVHLSVRVSVLELLGLVQSPDVLEGSSDVCDVLIGNINDECRLLVKSVAERNSVECQR